MSDEKIYSIENLKTMIGDDESAIYDFTKMFLSVASDTLDEFNQRFEEKKYKELGALSHKLKSSIDLMGITQLHTDIRVLEKNGKEEKNLDEIPALVEKVNSILNQVFNELKADFKFD